MTSKNSSVNFIVLVFWFYSSLERGPAEKTNIDPKYILLKEITFFGNRSCEVMSSPFWLFKNFSSVFLMKCFLSSFRPMVKSSIFWTFRMRQPITLRILILDQSFNFNLKNFFDLLLTLTINLLFL